MKIKYAIAASLLLSIGAYAQKEELKALKKLDDKQKPTAAESAEYKKLLGDAEGKMGSATPEQQVDFNYYKGKNALNEMQANPSSAGTNFPVALASFNKVLELEKSGKKKYTETIEKMILPNLKASASNMGQALAEKKMYKEAAMAFAAAYEVDNKDYGVLYNAAAMAVNGQDYDGALKYYEVLDKSGYTGESTVYVATNKATNSVEGFPNKSTRDIAVNGGQYILPKEEKIPSVRGEIVKNIALIYNMKGDTEKAKAAFVNARKANPNDTSLMLGEAEIYLKAKDMVKYKEIIKEVVQKTPNDPILFFNLGVVTAEADPAEAIGYYKKAIELDPKYVDPNINLGVLMLKDEQKIVDQMNKLGTSAKDNQRYEDLKKQRDGLYKSALPYFEKANQLAPANKDVISLLASVYQALDRQAEYKAMKAKM